MPAVIYPQNKQNKIQSKYHQVAKRFEWKYKFIHRKLTSRFHRKITETEFICSKINNLITPSREPIESKIKPKSFHYVNL